MKVCREPEMDWIFSRKYNHWYKAFSQRTDSQKEARDQVNQGRLFPLDVPKIWIEMEQMISSRKRKFMGLGTEYILPKTVSPQPRCRREYLPVGLTKLLYGLIFALWTNQRASSLPPMNGLWV